MNRWSLRVLDYGGNTETPQKPGEEVRPGSESRANAPRVRRELGRTEGVLGTKRPEEEGDTG